MKQFNAQTAHEASTKTATAVPVETYIEKLKVAVDKANEMGLYNTVVDLDLPLSLHKEQVPTYILEAYQNLGFTVNAQSEIVLNKTDLVTFQWKRGVLVSWERPKV